MNDLIGRQEAIAAFKPYALYDSNRTNAEWVRRIELVLEQLPTIDAVPVVRCKDCKHWGIHKRLNVPWCRAMHIDKSANGYCDFAERSEDETN